MVTTSLRRVWLWLPPLLYMAIIYFLSSQEDPLPTLTEHVWDKALHLVEYGGLAFLLCRALAGEGRSAMFAIIAAVLAASAYGASDEWHQLFTPHRNADYSDWLADTLGGAVGAPSYVAMAMVMGWQRLSRPSRPPHQPRR